MCSTPQFAQDLFVESVALRWQNLRSSNVVAEQRNQRLQDQDRNLRNFFKADS